MDLIQVAHGQTCVWTSWLALIPVQPYVPPASALQVVTTALPALLPPRARARFVPLRSHTALVAPPLPSLWSEASARWAPGSQGPRFAGGGEPRCPYSDPKPGRLATAHQAVGANLGCESHPALVAKGYRGDAATVTPHHQQDNADTMTLTSITKR